MDTLKKKLLLSSSRIVIKVGSSLLVNSKNNLINRKVLNNICEDINFLITQNKEVLVVSSGALALGKKAVSCAYGSLKNIEWFRKKNLYRKITKFGHPEKF